MRQRLARISGVVLAIRRNNRLRATGSIGLITELDVPVLYETVMAVELQVEVLIRPELHQLRPSPAGTEALSPANIENRYPAILLQRLDGLIASVLPTYCDVEVSRMARLADAVLSCSYKLRIAIRGDRHEDAHRRVYDSRRLFFSTLRPVTRRRRDRGRQRTSLLTASSNAQGGVRLWLQRLPEADAIRDALVPLLRTRLASPRC